MTPDHERQPDLTWRAPNPTALPDGLETVRHTAAFTTDTIPTALLKDHNTKIGTWGLIRVAEGVLRYDITDTRRPESTTFLTPESEPGIVEPTVRHRVEPIGATRFHVEFLREPNSPRID
jgi:tellurite resistance-related uncharacterized protein